MKNKYYFVRCMFANEVTCRYEERSSVTCIHPFDFVKGGTGHCILLDYKEITKEEYDKW